MKKDKRIKELDDWLKNSNDDDFFSNSFKSNAEFIKIICGKGTNSVDNIPKIKITTQAYIKKSLIVNAACTAIDRDGGVGVIKVKLKY